MPLDDWIANPPSQATVITTLGAACVGYITLMTALRTLRASLTLIRYGVMVLALLGIVGMVDEQTAGTTSRGVRRESSASLGRRGLDYWTNRASAQMDSAVPSGWRDVLPSGMADNVPREAKDALDWVNKLVSDGRGGAQPAPSRTGRGAGRRAAAAAPAEASPGRDVAVLALRKAFSGLGYSSRGAMTVTGLALRALNAVR